jgi:hypothetical protein
MANTLTCKETIAYLDDAGNLLASTTRAVSGDLKIGFKDTVAAGVTNQIVAIAFAKARTNFFVFSSDQPVTLKTNSTSSPQETIALPAGGVYAWNNLHTESNPLIGDVTAIYVTNAGPVVANVVLFVETAASP